MPIESTHPCSHNPSSKPKSGIFEQMDEFFTFREESRKKLEEKKRQEQERIKQETRDSCTIELRLDRKEFMKMTPPQKVDLDSLGKMQEFIGPKGTVRKLLFGRNNEIIKSNGAFGSADEQILAQCDKMGQNTDMCKTIRKKEYEKIRLSGVVDINFGRNLDEVWQYKMQNWSSKESLPDIQTFYNNQLKPFISGEKQFTKISRKDYEKEVRDSIKTVRANADMNKGFSAYGISSKEGLELAKNLERKISEADLIALGITEIMDKNSPSFNSAVLTTILEKGGKEYLLSFPALGDNLLSYGPYQLTCSAVDGNSSGAGMADDRFTGGKMLKVRDITKFPFEDHHKAAYLLTLTNIALLVKSLPEKHLIVSGKGKNQKKSEHNLQKTFLDLVKRNNKDALNLFSAFVAGAHNRQDVAKKGVVNWLVAYSSGNNSSTSGGVLSSHISKKSPTTVANNADKQTGGKSSDGGNLRIVLASLDKK